jgi:hypothetical protein
MDAPLFKVVPSRVRPPAAAATPGDTPPSGEASIRIGSHLADEYDENSRRIGVRDVMVCNEYVSPSGGPNEHKSYGYLRTPEVSDHIARFL